MLENITTVIGLLGIGGILGTYLRLFWEKRNEVQMQKQEYKTERYKCIIILMYSCLDFAKSQGKLKEFSRNFKNKEDLIDELKTEWYNLLLYGSDDVVKNMQNFIIEPNKSHFKLTSLSMRKDLWGGKINLGDMKI